MSEVAITVKNQSVRVTQRNDRIFIRFLETNTLQTINTSGGSGVTSFNSRTGAVVPVAADYDGFFLTPAEGNAAYNPLLGFTPSERILMRDNVSTAQTGSASALVIDFYLIPANTMAANDWLTVELVASKSGTAGNLSIFITVNPNLPTVGSAAPGGGITIGQIVSSAGSLYSSGRRVLRFKNSVASQIHENSGDSGTTDWVTSANALNARTIDFTANQYVVMIYQLGSAADTGTLQSWEVKLSRA